MTGRGRRTGKRDERVGPPPPVDRARDDEAVWLAQVADGDTAAYAHLVRAHQDKVFGLVLRIVRDRELAEEITQDTFLKAFRGLDRFRGEARFSTWLYRIAVNLCHDHRQSRTARTESMQTSLDRPENEGVELPAPGGSPQAAVESAEVQAAFATALSGLDETYRTAFLLRHERGLSYQELSEVLDISLSNAKVRVHRARERLLGGLRELGFDV